MNEQTLHMRKKQVSEYLIQPLEQSGMRKQHRFRLEGQEVFLDQLRNRLAYLDVENLKALLPIVEGAAGGKRKNTWPDLVSITNWAKTLQHPPDGESRLITSYMASAAGRAAWGRGPEYAVMLRKYLRRWGRPPNDYAWQELNRDASEVASNARRIVELNERGKAYDHEQEWLAGYQAAVERARHLVHPNTESKLNETA